MPAIETKRQWKSIVFRPDWILALALTALAIWLHLYFLGHAGGFSRDEVNLLNLSHTDSFSQMERDSFPVLMPVLVCVWSAIGLGQTDTELRILGTLIGLGIPAALWLAAWRIRRSPPVLSLVLLAINTLFITFGDSLRAYGLGSLTIALTAAVACSFLKTPTWRWTAVFAVLAVLSVQALYQNTVLIAAICFGAWAVCARQKDMRAALKILLVAVISAASLLPYLPQIMTLPDAAKGLRSGFDPALIQVNLDNALGFPFEQYIWIWAFFILAAAVCAMGALYCPWKMIPAENSPVAKRTALAVALAAAFGVSWFITSPETHWCALPLLALAVIYLDSGHWLKYFQPAEAAKAGMGCALDDYSLFAGVTLLSGLAAFFGFLWYAALPTESWYFLPLMALAAVCFEIGLPRTRHLRAAIFGFAIMTVLIAVPAFRTNLDWRFTNLDLIARQVATQAAPDDYIIVTLWYDGITFDRYYHGATPWDTLPPLKDHSIHRYDLVLQEMKTPGAIQPVLDKISATLQAGHRVWIVGAMDLPKPGPMPETLASPPLKYSGWADRPYDIMWENQLAQFLGNHSRTFALVYSSTNLNVNASECLKLNMAAGWQDSTRNPNAALSPTPVH